MTNSIFALGIVYLIRIMKLSTGLILVFLVLAFSCSKRTKTTGSDLSSVDTLIQSDKKNITSIGVSLHPNTKKAVENWKEYQAVDAILTNFYAISNAEALSNAKELSGVVIKLKDSIRDEKLVTPPVKARINILHNECLRLNDMSNIPAITPEEVKATIQRVLDAFSSLNAKLNSLYSVDELESELRLDPDFLEILNDTTNAAALDFSLLNPPKKPIQNKPLN